MDVVLYMKYTSLIEGVISGNMITTRLLKNTIGDNQFSESLEDAFDLGKKTCSMTIDQLVRIVKKWCDDNPSETDTSFTVIVYLVLDDLPIRDCE